MVEISKIRKIDSSYKTIDKSVKFIEKSLFLPLKIFNKWEERLNLEKVEK